ncbi:hypothetical protein RvY_02899 [Ramazzottius varieornatus]|uniref:Uncharacterized protein n=1 Tax=Ramazzottius varieornatus TaxID=947166 RepID=A0A1D1URZ9_RAMVA|nr:hypothetical protein RvY_02899 [Ramazzottius varieornatus]
MYPLWRTRSRRQQASPVYSVQEPISYRAPVARPNVLEARPKNQEASL